MMRSDVRMTKQSKSQHHSCLLIEYLLLFTSVLLWKPLIRMDHAMKFGFQKYRLEDANAYKARRKVKRRTQKGVSAAYTPL